MFPRYPGQSVDGVFIDAGQARRLSNAVLLEKMIQNADGFVLWKPATRKRRAFPLREVGAANGTIQHADVFRMPRPTAVREISKTLFAEFRTRFILAAELFDWDHGFSSESNRFNFKRTSLCYI